MVRKKRSRGRPQKSSGSIINANDKKKRQRMKERIFHKNMIEQGYMAEHIYLPKSFINFLERYEELENSKQYCPRNAFHKRAHFSETVYFAIRNFLTASKQQSGSEELLFILNKMPAWAGYSPPCRIYQMKIPFEKCDNYPIENLANWKTPKVKLNLHTVSEKMPSPGNESMLLDWQSDALPLEHLAAVFHLP